MVTKPGPRRKALFISLLAAAGILGAAILSMVLIAAGVVRFDWSESLRRRAEVRRAGSHSRRVLVVGDSFLTDWPVVHCLSKDIPEYLNPGGIGVVTAAAGGYGPYEYLDQVRSIAPTLKPGLVMLFYYVGNDLTDVQYRPDPTPRLQRGVQPVVRNPSEDRPRTDAWRPGEMNFSISGVLSLLDPSTAAIAADAEASPFDWEKYRARGIDEDLIRRAQNRVKNPVPIGPEYVNPYLLELACSAPRYVMDNVLMETETNRLAWEKVEAQLEQIVEQLKPLGSRLCIVCIPSTVQVDRSHFDLYRKATFELNDRLLTSIAPQVHLRTFCKKHSAPFIDLLPAFRAAPDPAKLYWENDEHLSEQGHQLAFEVIRKEFLDEWLTAQATK